MKTLSDEERRKIWEEVAEEFPDDRMMQEIHFARYLRYHELEDLPPRERIQQYLAKNNPVAV